MPILAGVVVLATGSDRNASLARWIALAGALLGLIVAIPLFTGFDTATSAMQFVEKAAWIPAFNIHYHLGVDGISMLFILLNSFITVLVVIAGWKVIQDKVAQYMAAFLIMSGLINGVFASLDGILFYVFWEAMLIPMLPDHRRVGRAEPRVCRVQVLPLHPARLAADAGVDDLPVFPVRRQLRHPDLAQHHARR